MKSIIITIGRQFGSGGHELGRKLAARLNIPFYELNRKVPELPANRQYLLYCDRGAMSRMHAVHLKAAGHENIKVYAPAA